MSNCKNAADSKINDKDIIRGFIDTASMGFASKEEIAEKYQFVEEKIEDLNSRIAGLEEAVERWELIAELQDSNEVNRLIEEYGTEEVVVSKRKKLIKEREQWAGFLIHLESLLAKHKKVGARLSTHYYVLFNVLL